MGETPQFTEIKYPTGQIDISKLIDARGQIGQQGFTREGVESILHFITQESFSDRPSLKEIIDYIKNSPELLKQIIKFLEDNPIEISILPDGTIHILDGHHRAFIAYQIGMTSLPVK